MIKLDKYISTISHTLGTLKKLEEEYKGKEKGEIYQRRRDYLVNKVQNNNEALKAVGKATIYQWKASTMDQETDIIQDIYVWYSSEFLLKDVRSLITINHPNLEVIKLEIVNMIYLGEFETSKK